MVRVTSPLTSSSSTFWKHSTLVVFTILTSLFVFAYFLHKWAIIQHFSRASICEPTPGLRDSGTPGLRDSGNMQP